MPTFNNDCPVPSDQQPFNEYLNLKKTSLFSQFNISVKQYIYKILATFIYLFCFLGFVLSFLMIYNIKFIKIFTLDFILVDIILICVFLRLYLSWSYISKRLLSATIFYEESGWYDGQVWVKTSDIMVRDRLIGLYQVIPFLKRIKYTLLVFIINLYFHYYLYSLF
uniref:Ycf36 n=1 Tax=Taenioma perpusillum TaxID=210852 RepID=A0A1Z1MRR6_9FLOR|nr:hypothetical protein [Taenioma perpusillum]ARW68522.1 hypothetical protein [Taenioma perpusillum]